MRNYADIISQIRIAAIGVKKQSNRLTLMQDAADAIEELLKENGEIENSGRVLMAAFARLKEKVPHWISVKERLPEDCKDVFVWAVYNEEYGRSWALREVDAYCKGVGWENTADPDVREVTHWMPMHEPPEKER